MSYSDSVWLPYNYHDAAQELAALLEENKLRR